MDGLIDMETERRNIGWTGRPMDTQKNKPMDQYTDGVTLIDG